MPITNFHTPDPYEYLNGFNSYHESESIPNTLPIGRNSPQKPAHGLYTEKISGSAFTAPRHSNKQTWLYRILPAATHSPFAPLSSDASSRISNPHPSTHHQIPNQLLWSPFDLDPEASFYEGLHMVASAGDASIKNGLGIYILAFGKDMKDTEAFYSADGDLLIVPQHGVLDIRTELGRLIVRPNEITVIPRGIRFQVKLPAGPVRGFILETFTASHFELPELGPIGSNGLANARDFQVPTASYLDPPSGDFSVVAKFDGRLFQAKQDHTPFDVVAWHGTYYPYKYDLARFNTIGSISFDHPDPSIFTVLTCPSGIPGTAVADFVIFPPRWLVGEDTFRPPWYHRNCMSEFMGIIHGEYDAKSATAFSPGGAVLHNIMAGHGPDGDSTEKASEVDLTPSKVGEGSMTFMFESMFMVGVTEWGLKTCNKIQEDYSKETWSGIKRRFKAPENK